MLHEMVSQHKENFFLICGGRLKKDIAEIFKLLKVQKTCFTTTVSNLGQFFTQVCSSQLNLFLA